MGSLVDKMKNVGQCVDLSFLRPRTLGVTLKLPKNRKKENIDIRNLNHTFLAMSGEWMSVLSKIKVWMEVKTKWKNDYILLVYTIFRKFSALYRQYFPYYLGKLFCTPCNKLCLTLLKISEVMNYLC